MPEVIPRESRGREPQGPVMPESPLFRLLKIAARAVAARLAETSSAAERSADDPHGQTSNHRTNGRDCEA